jgi:SAM-dependent MidA family methyltransferase
MTFATMYILAIALAAAAGYVLGYGMSASGEDHRAREREAEQAALREIIIENALELLREQDARQHECGDRALAWNKHRTGQPSDAERN